MKQLGALGRRWQYGDELRERQSGLLGAIRNRGPQLFPVGNLSATDGRPRKLFRKETA